MYEEFLFLIRKSFMKIWRVRSEWEDEGISCDPFSIKVENFKVSKVVNEACEIFSYVVPVVKKLVRNFELYNPLCTLSQVSQHAAVLLLARSELLILLNKYGASTSIVHKVGCYCLPWWELTRLWVSLPQRASVLFRVKLSVYKLLPHEHQTSS